METQRRLQLLAGVVNAMGVLALLTSTPSYAANCVDYDVCAINPNLTSCSGTIDYSQWCAGICAGQPHPGVGGHCELDMAPGYPNSSCQTGLPNNCTQLGVATIHCNCIPCRY